MNAKIWIFASILIVLLNACAPAQAPATPTLLPTLVPTDTALPAPTQTDTLFPTATTTALRTLTSIPTAKPKPTSTASPIPRKADELEQAVTALRRSDLDFDNLSDEQENSINQAFETIIDAGPEGSRRLKQELATIQQAGEADIPFQLEAAWLLWEIGGLDEVETIADVWSAIPMKDWNSKEWSYRFLFMPTMKAAATQDPRALPMLKVLLSDKEGKPYPMLGFPETHEFIWGAYGSVGLPVLYEVLQTSNNPVEIESAIHLLADAQYLPALPEIRKALDSQDQGVQASAILALGIFGHPDDYDRLNSGLNSKDPDLVHLYAYALIVFGDTRAVPHLIPYLQDKDRREGVAWGLGSTLASPESLAALKAASSTTTDQEWAKSCESLVENVLASAGLTWDEFNSLPREEQVKVTDNFRYASITLKPGEKPITHDQLLEVVAEWRETGRIGSEKWEWVETRHILPIATADDINLLLDGKAKFYLRLSDECIEEARIVDDLIKWIGRSRYR